MEKLPMEITENILHLLQAEPALQAKRVCTTWRFLLRSKTDKVGLLLAESHYKKKRNKIYYGDEYDPISGKMNYNYSSYDKLDKILNGEFGLGYTYPEDMIGSCNGFVCFVRECAEKPFLICNPITGEVVYAPGPSRFIAGDGDASKICGFGYCYSKNEYKIVRMHYQGHRMSHVLVYTVGRTVWRSKGFIDIHPLDIASCISPSGTPAGVYANGALHWLHRKNDTNKQHINYAIMAFDLEDETFEFMDLSHFENLRYHRPKVLGGHNLYMVFSTFDNESYSAHIWAYKRENANTTTNACKLKENYTDKNSWHWMKEFSIECENPFGRDPWFIVPEPWQLQGTMNLYWVTGARLSIVMTLRPRQ